MHYYLFGDTPDTIFGDGATSLDDIEVSHYYLLLDYLSKSDFVYGGHRRYFEKELVRARESHEKVRERLQHSLSEGLEREWEEEYASCTPRSQWLLRCSGMLARILNGAHSHRFHRTIGGLHCQKCSSSFSRIHDLGAQVIRGTDVVRVEMGQVRFRERRVPRRTFEHSYCVRCGSLPMPFWVSRARRVLRPWYRAGIRRVKWFGTQVSQPIPWSLLISNPPIEA